MPLQLNLEDSHMKKTILLAALAASVSLPAFAADLPMKAKSKFLSYPTICGFYYGGMASGSGGGASGASFSGAQVLAGDVGIVAGYTCPIGTTSFWFAEGIASLSKVNGADTGSNLKLAGTASFEQRFGVGAPWSVVQALVAAVPGLGGVSVPSVQMLPGGVTAGITNPYVFLGVNERDVSAQAMVNAGRAYLVSGEVGFGTLTRLSNGMVLDTFVKYQPASTKLRLGASGGSVQMGDFVGFGVGIKL